MKDIIKLTGAEIQSGRSRVDWAEGLIEQLPNCHEGRNSWLINYGKGMHAQLSRNEKKIKWVEETESAETVGYPIERKTISFNQLTDGVIIDTIDKEVEEGCLKGLNYDRVILSEEIFNMTCIRSINTKFGEIEIQKGSRDIYKNFLMDSGKLYFKGQYSGLPSNAVLDLMKEQGVIKEIEFIFTTWFEKSI